MTYRAPVADIAFTLKHGAGLARTLAQGGDLAADDVDAVLEEAGKFATDVIAPLNAVGDKFGTPFKDGAVTMPPGWKEAYSGWAAAGWNGFAAPSQWGGQGLPHALNAACIEMWNSALDGLRDRPGADHGRGRSARRSRLRANSSSTISPSSSPANGWARCSSPSRRPAPTSARLRTKAVRASDGSYRITGQKIFITYGEHDLTDNIIHFVLARLPDAPPGNRGISLFLVPKFLVNEDGVARRAQRRALPLDRAQARHPRLADLHDGLRRQRRRGRLPGRRGEPRARLHVHHDEPCAPRGRPAGRRHRRARDAAGACLCARPQAGPRAGAHPDRAPIIEHPDVKRMLLTMRALTRAARAICYATAGAIDAQPSRQGRRARKAARRARLAAHAGRQSVLDRYRHRGRLARRPGAWRHGLHRGDRRRAASIATRASPQIYEGTNGIQAIDLVDAQAAAAGGAVVRAYLDELRAHRRGGAGHQRSGVRRDRRAAGRCGRQPRPRDRRGCWARSSTEPEAALAGATPYLRLFGIAAGGCMLADEALAALRVGNGEPAPASRSRASSPRTSRCRRPAWNAP